MKQKNVILMVVAVGCGLVAAFLTSQMSAKGQVEQVDVVVAAKDLPVGTMITREDLKTAVKIKKVPKDGLPPAYVTNPDELVDKKLSRPVRTDETFNPQELTKGGVVTLPDGYDMMSIPVGGAAAVAGFVGPGSRVDVLTTRRLGSQIRAFPLLVNMLVVAVDTNIVGSKEGTYPATSSVSFAVKEKEALLLSLARSAGCSIELKLRHPNKSPEADKGYNIDEVIKLLQDDKEKVDVRPTNTEKGNGGPQPESVKPDPSPAPAKPVEPSPAPAPMIAVVKVWVAKHDIAANTDVTNDLIAEAFELKELPKDFAEDALLDLTLALGKSLKTGVSKNQWVTGAMVGVTPPKPAPQDQFVAPKPQPPEAGPTPPSTVNPVVKRKIHDVAVHTASGTLVHRYEEVAPGQWKKIAELSPDQAAREDKPEAPKAAPGDKKVD